MKIPTIVSALFCFAFCSHAQTNGGSSTSSPAGSTSPASGGSPSLPSLIASSDYKIAAGDTMQFWVIGDTETNVTVRVSQEGKVSLPYIGNVSVGGISVSEAKDKIYALYKPDYYVDPQINLIVTNVTVKIVSFMGTGINRPGSVEIPSDRPLYLLEAISKAGGFARIGSAKVEIKRSGPKGELIKLKVDTTKIGPKDYPLEPNDIIDVREFTWSDDK